MGIGTTLNELIKAKKTNANELANNIGVSAQTIYGIIKRDNKKVDFDVLVKISKTLGVDVEYFYNAEYSKNELLSKNNNSDPIDELIKQYSLSAKDREILESYVSMSEENRNLFYSFIKTMSRSEQTKESD